MKSIDKSKEILNNTKNPSDKFLFLKNISLKVLLSSMPIQYNFYEIPNDPIFKLLSNSNEIEPILDFDNFKKIKCIYFGRNIIHQILYEEEKEIPIKYEENNKNNIAFFFYLSLLIIDNMEIVNYSYSFDYLKKINEDKNNIDDKYKLTLMAKITIELINNYRGTEDYGLEKEEKIKKIENENNEIIKKNLNIFKSIGLNWNEDSLKSMEIDKIYIEIINTLIKNRKFEDYDYTYNIINQLDLENIYLTKKMFDELSITLNSNENYINDYIILNEKDLNDENKINFYYILLKYILKNSFFIYQIPIFLKLKIKLINLNLSNINNLQNITFKNKLEYIIKIILDSEYYFANEINFEILNKLKEILKYYNNFFFDSKKNEINIIRKVFKINKRDCEKYLQDYDIAKRMNQRYLIIKYLYENSKYKNIKEETKFKKSVDKWENIEKIIIDKKYNKVRRDDIKNVLNFFKDLNNKEIFIKIFGKKDGDNILINLNNHFSYLFNSRDKREEESSSTENNVIINEKNNINTNPRNINLAIDSSNQTINLDKNSIIEIDKNKENNLGDSSYLLIDKNDLQLRLSFCYKITITEPIEINVCDPISKLLIKYSDLESIIIRNEPEITKFLYFNHEYVNKILNNSNKNIIFSYEEKNKNLSFYFYLNLLINDNSDNLKYNFKEDYIKELNKQQENNNNENNKINKIILSKIIIEIIKVYEKTKNNNKEENEKILNYNLEIIQSNIDIFKELQIIWNKDDICNMKLDKIYIEIINTLIKNRKFEDYDYTYNIINQLDLENIYLTKKMFDELSITLNSNENYINDYIILNEKDLNDENKINFYYILLKYILKNDIYIYQIPLLIKTRNAINKIKISVKTSIKEDIKEKIKYICQKLLIITILKKFTLISLKELSELNCLIHVNKILLNKEIFNQLIHFINRNIYSDYDNFFKLFSFKNKEKEKFKEIINNVKFQSYFREYIPPPSLIELIKEIFYFSEPFINIDDLERYISENSTINPESIAYLKDWLDKDEKNNTDEDN